MTRWEVFRLLCACLAPARSAVPPTISGASIPWPLVVEAADDHLVGPAVGWCIRADEGVPPDVRACFETLLDLNRRRNQIMLRALDGALGSLNAEGITPMVLKGGAALIEDLYADPGMRIVGDLDLLVRDAEVENAAAALARAGFTGGIARKSFDAEPHHLPLRVHADLKVGVELHTHPVLPALDTLLAAPRCFRDARLRLWRDRQVLLPGPTDWMVHNIAHGQIVDSYYWRGIPRLRQLLELALLRAHFGNQIDMQGAEERFRSAGYRSVFGDTVLLSAFLLEGLPPAEAPPEASDAIKRLQAAVDRPATHRWAMYRRFLHRNVRRVMANPRFVVQTLRPSFWALEFKGIRRRIRVTRW